MSPVLCNPCPCRSCCHHLGPGEVVYLRPGVEKITCLLRNVSNVAPPGSSPGDTNTFILDKNGSFQGATLFLTRCWLLGTAHRVFTPQLLEMYTPVSHTQTWCGSSSPGRATSTFSHFSVCVLPLPIRDFSFLSVGWTFHLF